MRNRVREFRTKRKIAPARLAEAVGVSRRTLSAIENGSHCPSVSVAFRLAEQFGCSVEDIY